MGVSVGKYTKFSIMKKNEFLRDHLPKTELLTFESFSNFLDDFGEVIVKPCIGLRGAGVVQISSIQHDRYQFHSKLKKINIEGKQEAFTYLIENHLKKRKKYIVQEKIPLGTINGCPFDIRVMVQRKKENPKWKVTGIIVKVAAKGYIVTNYARGVMTIEDAIQASSLSEMDLGKIKHKLEEIGLHTAKTLEEHYKKSRRIGLDVGLTDKGDIWIIEANLKPTISMFDLLSDKSMYEAIKAYRK